MPGRAHRRNEGEQGISELLVDEKDPDLKSRVDDYRIRNYRLQQSENVDLYDAVDSLERDSYALRKSEKANAYLEAELEVCKMVQKVQDCISEAIRIGVPEI